MRNLMRRAWALMESGRDDQAVALVRDGLAHIDAGWTDAAKLKADYQNILAGRMYDLYMKKQYRAAITLYGKSSDVCRADTVCLDNVVAAYTALDSDSQNAGDWRTAREVLRECVSGVPGNAACAERLKDLESQHRF